MGRKSLAVERKTEILDAFEACVGESGFEVALERVAQRAGVKRQIITHYFGGRDALEAALIERLSQNYRDWFYLAIESLEGMDRVNSFLELIFPEHSEPAEDDGSLDGTLDALWAAAPARPELRARLRALYDEFARTLAEELAKVFPGAGPADCARVSVGVLALWVGADSLAGVARFRGADPHAARECAGLLIASLSPGSYRFA